MPWFKGDTISLEDADGKARQKTAEKTEKKQESLNYYIFQMTRGFWLLKGNAGGYANLIASISIGAWGDNDGNGVDSP